jgi:ribosome recycling factor
MKERIKKAEEKMTKAVAAMDKEFASIRAGRANPGVLDKLTVDYYGAPTPINQLASVSVSEARILVIQPWDRKALSDIEKAINKSDIGIHPNNDGTSIRLVFPPMTEERRKELTKEISKMGEECKVAVRSVRRDTNDKLKAMKKNAEITEDELKEGEKQTQNLTDKYCKVIDEQVKAKQTEILEI